VLRLARRELLVAERACLSGKVGHGLLARVACLRLALGLEGRKIVVLAALL